MSNTFLLASTYNSGTYGAGNYETSSTGTSSSVQASTGNSSILTNTGFDLLLIATLAVALIFIAFLVRFWKRPGSHNKGGAV